MRTFSSLSQSTSSAISYRKSRGYILKKSYIFFIRGISVDDFISAISDAVKSFKEFFQPKYQIQGPYSLWFENLYKELLNKIPFSPWSVLRSVLYGPYNSLLSTTNRYYSSYWNIAMISCPEATKIIYCIINYLDYMRK